MKREPGMRVLAIASAKWIESDGRREFVIRSYGEGTYRGETVPEGDAVRDFDALVGGASFLASVGATNPTIDLDSGETVYGCECWWGPINAAKQNLGIGKPNTRVEPALPSADREAIRAAMRERAQKPEQTE